MCFFIPSPCSAAWKDVPLRRFNAGARLLSKACGHVKTEKRGEHSCDVLLEFIIH